jgi:hypothetical protein
LLAGTCHLKLLPKRAIKSGGDSRFEETKKQPGKFTFFWMAQGQYMRINIQPLPL